MRKGSKHFSKEDQPPANKHEKNIVIITYFLSSFIDREIQIKRAMKYYLKQFRMAHIKKYLGTGVVALAVKYLPCTS